MSTFSCIVQLFFSLCVKFQFLHPPSFDGTIFLNWYSKLQSSVFVVLYSVRFHPNVVTTDFAFRLLLDSSIHQYMDYTRHPKQQYCDQGQHKSKSVNSSKIALCENKIDWALSVEFLFYRAKCFGI